MPQVPVLHVGLNLMTSSLNSRARIRLNIFCQVCLDFKYLSTGIDLGLPIEALKLDVLITILTGPNIALLITVNFTSLNISSDDSLANPMERAISIAVGLTSIDEDVFINTIPIQIFPGSHLLGGVSWRIRKTFKDPPRASFGIFAVRSTRLHDILY